MTAAELIALRLEQLGVRHVFGVGGANIEDLFVAVQRRSPALQVVLAKHEFSAGTAADGYARVRGSFGVVLTTSGAGAMNVVPALAESRASRVPVLAIIGEPPTNVQGLGAFQDTSGRDGGVDAKQVFSAVATFCERVEQADQLEPLLERALDAMLGPNPGPAVLLVAKDLQRATVSAPTTRERKLVPCGAPDPQVVAQALALVEQHSTNKSGDILIIAGDGVARCQARNQLALLAAALDARVAVSPDGRDAFDNDDPRFLGVAGMVGNAALRRALAQARVTILVGTRAPLTVRQGYEHELLSIPTVVLGPEPAFVCSNDSVHLRADVRAGLEALLAQLASPVEGRSAFPEEPAVLPIPASDSLSCRSVLAAVDAAIGADACVLVDAGNTGAQAVRAVRAPRNGRWLLATGMAGMGYTFGAAIGAALASGKRAVVIAGDGAFLMHGLEVHTALEHDIPITYLILNNNAHGMCLTRERLLLEQEGVYHQFRASRIGAGLSAMFPTLSSADCFTPLQLQEALAADNHSNGPRVICAHVDASEVPPFLAFEPAAARSAAPLTALGGDHEIDRYRKAV